MSKLLRSRWQRWSLVVAVLIALGCGIYQLQEPAPMCVIDTGRVQIVGLSADGRRLITCNWQHSFWQGPVKLWDTQTGNEIASEFRAEPILDWPSTSMDCRFFATGVFDTKNIKQTEAAAPDALFLVDFVAGKKMPLPVDGQLHLQFSPRGDLLIRSRLNSWNHFWIHESQSGRLLSHRDSAGMVCYADFLNDLIVHYVPTKTKIPNLELWNPRTDKTPAILEGVCGGACRSPDGRYLVAQLAKPDGTPSGKCVIWNLMSFQVDAEFQMDKGIERGSQHISPDGRWVAAYCEGKHAKYVELREIPSGRLHGTTNEFLHWFDFSPDSRFLISDDQSPGRRIVFELPSLKVLWKKQGVEFHPSLAFSENAIHMFAANNKSEIEAYDSATGELRAVIPFRNGQKSQASNLRLTEDRRFLWVHQDHRDQDENAWFAQFPMLAKLVKRKTDGVLVIDTNTCHVIFRLVGWNTDQLRLSDGGSTLVTAHEESDGRQVLRCWDVTAGKPLRWAAGVPVSLAATFAVLAWWRGRRENQAAKGRLK